MTEANIVSWTEGYNAYEQNPSAYKSMIPEGTNYVQYICGLKKVEKKYEVWMDL